MASPSRTSVPSTVSPSPTPTQQPPPSPTERDPPTTNPPPPAPTSDKPPPNAPGSTSSVTVDPPDATTIITSVITESPNASQPPNTVIVTMTSTPSPPPASSRTSAPPTSASSPPLSSSTASPDQSSSSSGLSAGAKTAIAVVVPVFVVALLIVGALFWWRRRKAQQKAKQATIQQIEGYGFNPNRSPTLPPVGLAANKESGAGYRSWGNTNTGGAPLSPNSDKTPYTAGTIGGFGGVDNGGEKYPDEGDGYVHRGPSNASRTSGPTYVPYNPQASADGEYSENYSSWPDNSVRPDSRFVPPGTVLTAPHDRRPPAHLQNGYDEGYPISQPGIAHNF